MNISLNLGMKSSLKYLLPVGMIAAFLTGCGMTTSTSVTSPVTVGAATKVSGIVMGGQQPVGGVSIQMYTVGTSGYGSAATPLGASFSTTSAGNFTLPAFTCPTPGALTFLVGTGGQPIAATQTTAAVTNPNLALMVGLGACSTVGSSYINVNELTTVATIWSLSPFMTGLTSIGAPSTNATGIKNAFAAINKVVNTTNGLISGPALPSNATLPIAEINTLADILEQCVNSGGGSASDSTDGQTTGTPCGKLFYLTGAPTNTIAAALYIAKNPALNVAKLNMLRSTSPVFQPVLSVNTPPSDWTIAISYSGGGLSTPQGVATDLNGNVWVANSGNSSVSEFSSTGAAISGTTGFTAGGISVPYALALDQSGNVWVANSGNNTVTKLAATGATGTSYSGNGLSTPKGIAIDGLGNVFVSNSGASTFSGFTSAGAALPSSPFTGPSAAIGIAVSPH
ncbi:hypothetical protein SAMN05421770_1173 [Granulicella rosea]|uniref:NHL repeat-containing protein n=1 Tax=Granulicella rosea TaxID=474952 RepID=A0A239MPZ2_9BACT|nr:NHL repeat-containing protein [Granulicella rosea]SNT43909.1 hypothetical protein SAMN05421770_1173 [Granulicella rosea]